MRHEVQMSSVTTLEPTCMVHGYKVFLHISQFLSGPNHIFLY